MNVNLLAATVFTTCVSLAASGISSPREPAQSPVHQYVASQSAKTSPQLSITDAELDELIAALEGLPEDLKTADPRTTPDYESKLSSHLKGFTIGNHIAPPAGSYQVRGLWQCVVELASVVVQYGFPVWKVLKWIKAARRMYGSISGIWEAIVDKRAFVEIGEEGASFLEMLLGLEGVVAECFG
ncbi:hypothetical protein [Actinotignum sp. GS-2025b]|uniref:hypothetical protein n=1 Tax=Actinotignum sp. GS-2025b TaxID=3427275 RepID=UPI003F46C7CA